MSEIINNKYPLSERKGRTKKLSVKGYRIIKIIHILSAAVWIGASAIGLFLLTVLLNRDNLLPILSAVHNIDLLVIVPVNLITFITGIIFSRFTQWGFFKHRWITLKYIINLIPITGGFVFASAIINMLSIADKIGEEALFDPSFILSKNIFMWAFIIILLLLITAVCLTVFKPELKPNKIPKRT